MFKLETCWTNPLDEYKNTKQKSAAWVEAVYSNKTAVDCNGKMFPVKNFDISKLAFIGGLWRVQIDFPYEITCVRKVDMVLLKKKNRVEDTLFEFWDAKHVGYNCYGPYISGGTEPEYIVAKYQAGNTMYWGYGKTLEEARAYLGLKVYDEYKHVIHAIANGAKVDKI